MSGIDVNKLLIEMALGQNPEFLPSPTPSSPIILTFFEFPSGKVKSIEGIPAAQSCPGVVDLGFSFKAGDTIHPSSDDRSRHGYLIAQRENIDVLDDFVETIRSLIKIHYE